MNYRISVIDFTNLNNFLKFLKKSDGTIVPVRITNRDQSLHPLLPVAGPRAPLFVPVGVPTGTCIRPGWIVPVGEPGSMAQTNRDNRLFFH